MADLSERPQATALVAHHDTVRRERERAMGQPDSAERSYQLAEFADAEAALWERVAELSAIPLYWRAALAAREHALGTARAWRRRGAAQRAMAADLEPTPFGAVA